LKKCKDISRGDAYLFILNTSNRDRLIMLKSIGCRGPFYSDYNDIVIIEDHAFNFEDSTVYTKWVVYRKIDDKKLEYMDKLEYKIRLYSIHEIIKLAEKAGWKYIDSYKDIETMETFNPLFSGLNIVFSAK